MNRSRAATLDQLQPGQRGTVSGLDISGPDRRRLMDLGLVPGTEVRVHTTSPLRDPTAYVVRDSIIALRRSQAREIRLEIHDTEATR